MLSDYTKVFRAFCEPKRLEILELLKSGEQCACVLLDQLDMTQSGLSYHMRILTDSGIVAGRQEGKWVYYSLCRSGLEKAIGLINEFVVPGSPGRAHCEE